jgi:hypothetical protein
MKPSQEHQLGYARCKTCLSTIKFVDAHVSLSLLVIACPGFLWTFFDQSLPVVLRSHMPFEHIDSELSWHILTFLHFAALCTWSCTRLCILYLCKTLYKCISLSLYTHTHRESHGTSPFMHHFIPRRWHSESPAPSRGFPLHVVMAFYRRSYLYIICICKNLDPRGTGGICHSKTVILNPWEQRWGLWPFGRLGEMIDRAKAAGVGPSECWPPVDSCRGWGVQTAVRTVWNHWSTQKVLERSTIHAACQSRSM